MRHITLIFIAALVSAGSIGCVGQSQGDGADAEDSGGKADGITYPSGKYFQDPPRAGQINKLTLGDDKTYTRNIMLFCTGGGTSCDHPDQTGTYKFTKSTTSSRRYIRFYDSDGTFLDRYQWTLSSGTGALKLRVIDELGDGDWMELTSDPSLIVTGLLSIGFGEDEGNDDIVPDDAMYQSIGRVAGQLDLVMSTDLHATAEGLDGTHVSITGSLQDVSEPTGSYKTLVVTAIAPD